jgi:hypothetical protein
MFMDVSNKVKTIKQTADITNPASFSKVLKLKPWRDRSNQSVNTFRYYIYTGGTR